MHTLHFKLTSHINLSLTLCLLYVNVRYHRSKFNHMSMLKALIRRSRSPTLAAWKSSGWFMRERAIRRAAQMLLDITWWLLLFLCWCRAVRKLFTASLQEKREVKHANIKLKVFFQPSALTYLYSHLGDKQFFPINPCSVVRFITDVPLGWYSWCQDCISNEWSLAGAPELWCRLPLPPHCGPHSLAWPRADSTADSPTKTQNRQSKG